MINNNCFVVVGIGTDIGKTVVSAVLCEALQANYWKPLQAGIESATDSQTVRTMISEHLKCFPEHLVLKSPESPHSAAEKENIEIISSQIEPPSNTHMPLIIEGAGGLMVPLNRKETFADLFRRWKFPVILVSKPYLGSINHTLLTVETLNRYEVPIAGMIFNGDRHLSSEEIILEMTGLTLLGHVPLIKDMHRESIKQAAEGIKKAIKKQL